MAFVWCWHDCHRIYEIMDYTSCQLIDHLEPYCERMRIGAFPATCHVRNLIPVFPQVTSLMWSIATLGKIFRCHPPCLTIPSFILTSFAAVPPQPSLEWVIWVIEAITHDGWSPQQDFSSVSRIHSFYLGAWVPMGVVRDYTLWPLPVLCAFLVSHWISMACQIQGYPLHWRASDMIQFDN